MSRLPEIQPQLEDLLDSGRRMLACAEAGDWESVDKLQLRCEQLSKDIFSKTPAADEAAACRAAIGELLEINQCIVELGRGAREVCMESVGSLNHSRNAIKEYTANAD